MTTTHFSANNMRLEMTSPRNDGTAVFIDHDAKAETRITCPNMSPFVRQATGDGCRLGNVRMP